MPIKLISSTNQIEVVKDERGFVHLPKNKQHLIVNELFILFQVAVHLLLQHITNLRKNTHGYWDPSQTSWSQVVAGSCVSWDHLWLDFEEGLLCHFLCTLYISCWPLWTWHFQGPGTSWYSWVWLWLDILFSPSLLAWGTETSKVKITYTVYKEQHINMSSVSSYLQIKKMNYSFLQRNRIECITFFMLCLTSAFALRQQKLQLYTSVSKPASPQFL